jgi:hypothetical protein
MKTKRTGMRIRSATATRAVFKMLLTILFGMVFMPPRVEIFHILSQGDGGGNILFGERPKRGEEREREPVTAAFGA